jgi:hypothetical protein
MNINQLVHAHIRLTLRLLLTACCSDVCRLAARYTAVGGSSSRCTTMLRKLPAVKYQEVSNNLIKCFVIVSNVYCMHTTAAAIKALLILLQLLPSIA